MFADPCSEQYVLNYLALTQSGFGDSTAAAIALKDYLKCRNDQEESAPPINN
ncbi:MAG: hypothetical protein KBS98_04170 [Flavobacterium sp.]|nr:hypothetical protein [Candidatus Neoflavobacterium equi]